MKTLTKLIISVALANFVNGLLTFGQCYVLKLNDSVRYKNTVLSDAVVRNDTFYFIGQFDSGSVVKSLLFSVTFSHYLPIAEIHWNKELSCSSLDTSFVLVTISLLNNSIITAGYVKIDSVYGIIFQRNSLSGDLIWRRIYFPIYFPSIVKTSLPIAPINIASVNNGITYFAGLSVSGSIDQNGTLQSLFVTEPFFFTNVQIVDTNRLLWSGIYANADTVDLVYVYTDYQFNVLYGYQLGTKGHDGISSLITNDLSFRNSYVVESIVFDTTLVLVAPTKGISFDTSDLEATLVIRVSNDSMGNVSSAYVFYGYSDFPTSFVPSKILLGFNSEIMIHGTVKLPDSNEVEAALLTLNYKDFTHQHYRRVGLWHHSIGLPILTFDSDGYLFNSFFSTEKYFYGNYINDIYYHCDNCQSSEIINILIRGHAIDDSVYIKPVLKPVFTVQDTPLMANTIVAATKFQSTLEMDCMIIDNVDTPKEPYPVYFVTHNLLYLGEEII